MTHPQGGRDGTGHAGRGRRRRARRAGGRARRVRASPTRRTERRLGTTRAVDVAGGGAGGRRGWVGRGRTAVDGGRSPPRVRRRRRGRAGASARRSSRRPASAGPPRAAGRRRGPGSGSVRRPKDVASRPGRRRGRRGGPPGGAGVFPVAPARPSARRVSVRTRPRRRLRRRASAAAGPGPARGRGRIPPRGGAARPAPRARPCPRRRPGWRGVGMRFRASRRGHRCVCVTRSRSGPRTVVAGPTARRSAVGGPDRSYIGAASSRTSHHSLT